MEIGNIIPHIEALIFASEKPLTAMELTELLNNAFGFMDEKLTLEQIQTAVDGIVEKYRSEFYPFEIRESGGGLQFLTKKDYHKTVAQLNGDKFLKRLSTAALETLSIIAYKQPVTKGDIEAIRGVSSDYAIQRLLEKELIVILGRNEKMPGHPLVYGTSKNFMDYFGINSAEDLPKLKEIFDESMVSATTIAEAEAGIEPHIDAETGLVVSETGELVPTVTEIPTPVDHSSDDDTTAEVTDESLEESSIQPNQELDDSTEDPETEESEVEEESDGSEGFIVEEEEIEQEIVDEEDDLVDEDSEDLEAEESAEEVDVDKEEETSNDEEDSSQKEDEEDKK